MIFVFKNRSIVRREWSIRHQNYFYIFFYFKKEVSCDVYGRLDTKTIFYNFVLKKKKKCRWTRAVDQTLKHFYNFV